MDNDRINDLAGELEALRAEVDELANAEELTDEQSARFDEAMGEFETKKAEHDALVARAERVEAIRAATVTVEPGDGPTFTPVITADRDIFDQRSVTDLTFRASVLDDRGASDEIIGRAKEAIETARAVHLDDDGRHAATLLVERTENPEIAAHILKTGSPAYHEAFRAYMRGNFAVASEYPEQFRAAMSLTGSAGGFLVPFTLDPTIVLTNVGASNPFRKIADQVSITTDDWNGVTSAGVTAEWLGEGSEAADASPTFTQPTITAHKAAAYLQASIEVTQDSNIASQIATLIADAKDRHEAAAFATGSGSSQPFGIVTALGLTTASRVAGSSGAAGAADLVAADIFALDNDLGDRYRDNASFVAHKKTWNAVRRLANVTAGNNPASFWTDFGGGLPAQLIGYPVYQSSAMDSTIVSGSNDDVIVLGDFRQGYKIVDRIGLAIAYNPLVIGSSQRPTGQVGWFAYWRVGGDSINDDAFRMLRL